MSPSDLAEPIVDFRKLPIQVSLFFFSSLCLTSPLLFSVNKGFSALGFGGAQMPVPHPTVLDSKLELMRS